MAAARKHGKDAHVTVSKIVVAGIVWSVCWIVITFPRHPNIDACSNQVDPNIRTLPALPFRCGWHSLRPNTQFGVYAYIQPNGSWCWNNAGYLRGKSNNSGLLIDTLTDPQLTHRMIENLPGRTSGEAPPIGSLIFTHPDIDHILGDQALPKEVLRYGRKIVNQEIQAAVKLKRMLFMSSTIAHYTWALAQHMQWRRIVPMMPDFIQRAAIKVLGWAKMQSDLSRFDFSSIDAQRIVGVTQEIDKDVLDLELDGIGHVSVVHYGSIHSKSDSVVFLPEQRVCFTGDLLFVGIAPLMWGGTASAWSAALSDMLRRADGGDSDWIFVPGHGPPTDAAGMQLFKRYMDYLDSAVTSLCIGSRTAHDDRACAESVLREMPPVLRAEFREPQRILVSAEVECMSRRRGGWSGIDLLTKVRLVSEQGVEGVKALLDKV